MLNGKRILVVSGDTTLVNGLTAVLQSSDCQFEVAGTSEEAGRLAAAGKFDAAIVDVSLTDESGFACLVKLRAAHLGLPAILVLSFGYDVLPSIAKARGAGVTRAVIQPLRTEHLLRELQQIFSE